MKVYIYILIFLFVGVRQSHSQCLSHLDSIKHYMKQKPKLTGYLDGRNSFTEASKNSIFGGFVGGNFGSRIDLGIGYYTTYNEKQVEEYINVGTKAQDTFYRLTKYYYFSLRGSYEFYHTKKWEASIPVGIGLGQGSIDSFTKFDKFHSLKNIQVNIAPIEAGIDVTYLFTPWFVFSSGIGYRVNLSNINYNKQFSAIYYRYGFGIRFGYIYKKVKKTWFGRKCCCII